MDTTAHCDCQKFGRLLFFCVEVDCSMSRRLCASCRQKHLHHDIRQLYKQDSFKQFSINEHSIDKNFIIKQIFIAQNTINKLKNGLIQDINALTKLWEQQMQKTILKPLQLIKNTTFSQYQTEIRITIQSQATTVERLNEIAKQIRELRNPSLKQKSAISDICQNTLYIITQEMIILREQLSISNNKFIKSIKELYPFAPINQKLQSKIKKSKQKLKNKFKSWINLQSIYRNSIKRAIITMKFSRVFHFFNSPWQISIVRPRQTQEKYSFQNRNIMLLSKIKIVILFLRNDMIL